MAEYDKKRFYWLQLKEDFFDDDAINWLEEQQPKGKEYAYFYLKLCLKSLKTNGVLIRNVGKMLIPYDNKKLAEITKTDFDTVVIAMKLLEQIGLIEILENGEIYLKQLENLVGSKSIGAFKKQQQIARRNDVGGKGVEKLPPKLDIELDIELKKKIKLDKELEEKETKKEKEEEIVDVEEILKKQKEKQQFAEFVFMTEEEYNKLCLSYGKEFVNECINKLDNYKGASGKRYKSDYRAILTWVVDELKKTSKNKSTTNNPFLEIAKDEGIL